MGGEIRISTGGQIMWLDCKACQGRIHYNAKLQFDDTIIYCIHCGEKHEVVLT